MLRITPCRSGFPLAPSDFSTEGVGLQRAVEAEGMSWLHLDLRDRWIPWDSEAYLMDLVLPLVDALQADEIEERHIKIGQDTALHVIFIEPSFELRPEEFFGLLVNDVHRKGSKSYII